VYVGGLVGDEPFEYRSNAMDHVQLPVTDEHVDLRFDVSGWTTDWSSSSFDDPSPHQLSEDHNAELAATLERRIAASLSVCDQCD
jgi:hypothetical protein